MVHYKMAPKMSCESLQKCQFPVVSTEVHKVGIGGQHMRQLQAPQGRPSVFMIIFACLQDEYRYPDLHPHHHHDNNNNDNNDNNNDDK